MSAENYNIDNQIKVMNLQSHDKYNTINIKKNLFNKEISRDHGMYKNMNSQYKCNQ